MTRSLAGIPFIGIPIVQAPMAGGSTPALVAAVSNAGGLGSLAVGYETPASIRTLIADVRTRTERPFAVNLFVDTSVPASADELRRAHERLRGFRAELGIPQPPEPPVNPLSFEEQFAAILEAHPRVFSFTFGIPPSAVLDACRSAGIFTIGTAKAVDDALELERAGVDAICVQGFEAGGHHGSFTVPVADALTGTLALVPQVVDAVRVPVLAAGGIGDGRAVAAVLALGATAAQVGSAFLLADESGASPAYRRVLASDAARRTVLTDVISGRYARGVRNRLIDELTGEPAIASYPHQHWLTRDVRAAAAAQERPEFLSMWTGQAVSLARALPAAEIVAALLDGGRAAAARAVAELRED